MNPTANKSSRYERHTGQEPNNIKRVLTNADKPIPETPAFELNNEDFESRQGSTILMRERESDPEEQNWKGRTRKERGVTGKQ